MSQKQHGSLSHSALRAIRWNYAGAVARATSQLIIGTVIARLLGPGPFGIVAVAWMFIGLGNLIADFGVGAALVQRKTISSAHIRYAFTIQVLTGVGLAAVVATAAPYLAALFHQPDAVHVIQVLAAVFVIQAMGQTAVSLLKRELGFKSIQVAQIASYLVAFIVLGIPLALAGLGVWSLVAAQLCQSLLNTVLLYVPVRHSVLPLFRCPDRSLLRFGTQVMGANLSNWLIDNADNVMIGRIFGAIELGLYNRAFILITSPVGSIVQTLQGVLFSAFSRRQDDSDALRKTYLAAINVLTLVIAPVYLAVALIPQTVIEGLYGVHWSAAAPLITPLALAMPFHAVMALAGPVLMGKGRVDRELVTQAIVAALFLLLLWLCSGYSMVHVAWGVLAIYVVRCGLMTTAVVRLLDISWREVFRAVSGGLLLSLGPGVTAVITHFALSKFGIGAGLQLVVVIALCAVVALLMTMVAGGYLLSAPLVEFMLPLILRLPPLVRDWVRRVIPLPAD